MGVNIYGTLVVGCKIRTCIHRESGKTLEKLAQEREKEMSGYIEFNEMFDLDDCTDGTGNLQFIRSGDSYEDDFLDEGILSEEDIIDEPTYVGIALCEVDGRNEPTWDVMWHRKVEEAQTIVRKTMDELGFDYQLEVAITTVVG